MNQLNKNPNICKLETSHQLCSSSLEFAFARETSKRTAAMSSLFCTPSFRARSILEPRLELVLATNFSSFSLTSSTFSLKSETAKVPFSKIICTRCSSNNDLAVS